MKDRIMKNIDDNGCFYRYESLREAVIVSLRLSNISVKQAGMALWPTLSPDTAHTKMLHFLKEDRDPPIRLKFEEVIYLCKLTGRDDPYYYMGDQLLFERPIKKSVEQVKQETHRTLEEIFSQMRKTYADYLISVKQSEENASIRRKGLELRAEDYDDEEYMI